MKKGFCDITLVVDRSGSMASICDEAQSGIREFVEEQAKQKGDAVLTLVEFNHEYHLVHQHCNIQTVPPYTLNPSGFTALLDAVGRTITATGARLAALPESERPELVIFVVMTDGAENSSKEFNYEQVRQMISHQEEKYRWQFLFLAAGIEASREAKQLGVDLNNVVNFSACEVKNVYAQTSARVALMRRGLEDGNEVETEPTQTKRTRTSKKVSQADKL